MSSSRTPNLPALAACLLLALTATGCRNPFMPSADADINRISCNGNTEEISAYFDDLDPASTTPLYGDYVVNVNFILRNKVGIDLTTANMVFTDLAGNPLATAYGATGKTMKLMARLYPMNAANSYDTVQGNLTNSVRLIVIDRRVVDAMMDPSLSPKFIICKLTLRGEDDNGYDVKLTTDITIKGYGNW